MRNLFIWIIGTIAGAFIGFWLSDFVSLHSYISLAIGAIVGSSFAITLNIQRSKEEEFNNFTDDTQETEVEEENSANPNQTTS